MTYAQPQVSYILWGKETSYPGVANDTEPATTCSLFFWEAQSLSDTNKNNLIKMYQIAGGRDITSVVNGRFESTLTIETNLTVDDDPWEILIGTLVTGTATPSNALPSFAVEIGFKDYAGSLKRVKFHGCKVQSWKLTYGKKGDPIKISIEIWAQRFWLTDTLQTPTAPTATPLTDFEAILSMPNNTALGSIQSFTFGMAHNLEEISDNDARIRKGLVEGNRDYTFDVSAYLDGVVHYTQAAGNAGYVARSVAPTAKTMKVAITKASNSVTLNVGNCYLEDISQPLDLGAGLVVQKFSGFAATLTSVVIA